MILKTLLNGKFINGFIKSRIVYPYSGNSFDFIEYTKNVHIDPYSEIKDISIFRSDLNKASEAIIFYLNKNKKKILRVVSDETGSPVSYHNEDMEKSFIFLKNLNLIIKKLSKIYRYEPKGNVLLVLSANEPIILATMLIFSSLFMGNTVFVRPSSKTPSYSFLLIRELVKISTFKKRIHFLLADKEEIERLIKIKSFDFVLSFGSHSTNKKLRELCSISDVEFLHEGEGNDWAYVDKDCKDLKKVSKILTNSFIRHNGQMCDSIRGVLVHSAVYNKFVNYLKSNVSSVIIGHPCSKNTQIGAVLPGTTKGVEFIIKNLLIKGECLWNYSIKNNIIKPALILDPKDDSLVISKNIFAPIVWIKKVDNYSDLVSFYKEKNVHGLGFSIFSSNKKIINELISKIKVGRLNVNKDPIDIGIFDPWGGIKISGRDGPSCWAEKISNRKYVNL